MYRARALLTVLTFSLLLVACGELDMQEARYRNNVGAFDGLIAKADPTMRADLEKRKSTYIAGHEKLPADKAARAKDLIELNKRTDKELKELGKGVENASAASASAEKDAMNEYRKQFVGTWDGDGMHLVIEPGGGVEYTRKRGGSSKSLNGASVKEFRRDAFDVSLLGISTRFKIDSAPHKVGDAWKMTIDGAELTRSAP